MQQIGERLKALLKTLLHGIPAEDEAPQPFDLSMRMRRRFRDLIAEKVSQPAELATFAPFNLLFSGTGKDLAEAKEFFAMAFDQAPDYAELRQRIITMHDALQRISYQENKEAWVAQANSSMEELRDPAQWGPDRLSLAR